MNRLTNKTAIVTGAAGGIGKAIALLFAQEGAQVLATDVQFEKLQEWVSAAREKGLPIACAKHDITSRQDWQQIADHTLALYGKLDTLIHNAGIYSPGVTMENIGQELWDKTLAINLTGAFIGTQVCLAPIRKSGKGSIIYISSIAGMVGGNGPAYSASKAAVRMLAKDNAVEFAKDGIRVNSIHPGGVLTPMTDFTLQTANADEVQKNMCPMERIGQPGEIAEGALFLASDESSYVTGSELVIDGGMIAR